MRARHSVTAGVSLAYLMGHFAHLAYARSGEHDPTFLRLKEVSWISTKCLCHILAAAPAVRVTFIAEVFWEGEDKIGSNLPCPRDGRMGCALVDWLMPEYRKKQTHFMPSDSEPAMFSQMGFCHVFLFKHHPYIDGKL